MSTAYEHIKRYNQNPFTLEFEVCQQVYPTDPADRPADERAKGTCLACGEPPCVPECLCRRKPNHEWPPHVRCRPCKLANDAHYAALRNTAPATTVASDAKFRAASPAALVASDGKSPDGKPLR